MKKIKLSKKNQARNRLIRNLLSSLILFEEVQTTPIRAKALKAKAESFLAKIDKMDDEVNCKRYIASILYGGAKAKAYDFRKNFEAIKFYKVGNRAGDNAEQTIVRLKTKEIKAGSKVKTKIAK